MNQSADSPRLSLPVRYLLGILLIVAVSLLIFNLVLNPPMSEIGLMAVYLSVTAVISALAGYTLYRLGWLYKAPTLRWAMISAYALSSALTFLNVWLAAWQMFADQHDLQLATVLLLFAAGMAMVLGYFLSTALADRIRQLDRAAQTIAEGDLDARVPVAGRDELATLADTFNRMAAQLQAAARKQQEIESLRRDLIAWTGHDLQTPLTSMRLILEALADGMVEDPQTVQRYLRTAQNDVRSLSLLVDDLFQLAQLDAGGLPLNRRENSLSDLVSEALESFTEMAARKGVELAGQVEAGAETMYIDAQLVARALSNLLSNALRHTPAGGRVSVTATSQPGEVRVEVTDSGGGIPEADLPYIFDRFYRGEKSRSAETGGSGLGLAISRGIILAHGGQIGAENTGQGARFYFTLPKAGDNE